MTDPISARETIARQAIARASAATGADFAALMATARRESSLNPQARAGTSSAAGMFQFIESTWLDMVRRHGAEHGLGELAQHTNDPAYRRQILDLRYDPEIAARMAGELWRENANFLRARLGRDPNEGELYAAHVMGPAGAARLIEAADRGVADASSVFPREAAANRHLFFTRDGDARSAQGLLQRLALDLNDTLAAKPDADAITQTQTFAHRYARGDAPAGPSAGALSSELIDALFALALMPDEPHEEDPALRLLKNT